MELTVWRGEDGLSAKIPDEEFILVMGVGLDSCRLLEFSWGAVHSLVYPVSQDFNGYLLHWVHSSEQKCVEQLSASFSEPHNH